MYSRLKLKKHFIPLIFRKIMICELGIFPQILEVLGLNYVKK
ncbi:hypothetical protein FDUTEX481_08614 [Tolypothrix sp. PCC 7601]|nr:hypothetical protein FDUTEX481_08614 [Tolypothrix sp. PCC 7601]